MGSQAQQAVSHEAAIEAPLTRRQIAARKHAAAQKAINQAAKAWLAGRQGSTTPVADRLIARHIGKGWDEASARKALQGCLTFESDNNFGLLKTVYSSVEGVAMDLSRYRFSSEGKRYINAVALMQEAGVPAYHWEDEAAQLAAQAPAPAISAKNSDENNEIAPEPAPMIQADAPAAAPLPTLDEAWAAYNAASIACNAILKERNPRLRAISRQRGFVSEIAQAEKAQVIAEYADQLAHYSALARRASNLLIRMGHPPHPYAEIQDEDPPACQIERTENAKPAPPRQTEKAETETLTTRQGSLQVAADKSAYKTRKQDCIDFLQATAIQPQPFIWHAQMPHTDNEQQQQAKTSKAYGANNRTMNYFLKPFAPLLVKETLFCLCGFVRHVATFQRNTPQLVIIHAGSLLALRQFFVVVGDLGWRQDIITKPFTTSVVPFFVPRRTRLMSNAAQLQTAQLAVHFPYTIQYPASMRIINGRNEQLALISSNRLLLVNGITPVMFKLVIDRGNDRPVFPCLHVFTNQRPVIQSQRPAMGNVNQFNQLHRRDRTAFGLSLSNEIVSNSQRRLRLHGAIPNSMWQRAHRAIPINSSTSLAA